MATNTLDDLARTYYGDRTIGQWMNASNLDRDEIENDIAGRMDLGLLKVGEVVRELEPYVLDGDLIQTAEALSLVVHLLNKIQVPLERNNVHVLVEYFCGRLDYDGDILNYRAGIRESTECLLALANMTENKRFPVSDASRVAKAVFAVQENGRLHEQKNSTRAILFQLLEFLMVTYKTDLVKNVGTREFAQGIVVMAELEKDPICLQIIFGIYINLSKNWELDQATCLLIWESYVRYFPITLTTPSKDPLVPTPEELKSLLLGCFMANDLYAKEAFPRLIDMLDTEQDLSANVKKDVFDTIAACVSGYGLDTTLEWAPKIWDSLKFEIWNGEVEEFIMGSLKVINALARAISAHKWEWDDEENAAARFFFGVLKECVDRVIDSKQRFMLSTGRILYAIASASSYTFSRVAKKTLPALLTLWEDLSYKSEQTPLLTVFNSILQAGVEVGQQLEPILETSPQSQTSQNHLGVSQIGPRSSLVKFKERLVEQVYWKAMTQSASDGDTEFRVHTIHGMVLLTRIPKFLLDFEQGTIISSLNKIALDFTQPSTMREVAISALQQVSMHDPDRFLTITLPNFLSRLPERISATNLTTEKADAEIDGLLHILDALGNIACSQTCSIQDTTSTATFPAHTVFEAFQKSMLTKLFEVLRLDSQVIYAQCLLIAMSKGLKMFDDALELSANYSGKKNLENHPYGWIVTSLYQKLAVFNPAGTHIGVVVTPPESVQVEKLTGYVGQIATLALRSSQTTPVNHFLNPASESKPSQVWSLFSPGIPEKIDISQMELIQAPADKCLANILSMFLVAGISREEVSRLRFDVPKVASAMINNAIYGVNLSPFGRIAVLQFLQLLVNKFGASTKKDGQGATLIDHMKEQVEVASTSKNDQQTARVYQTLTYFTAASLNRCDPFDKILVKLMIKGILHPTVGPKVARCFRFLLAPTEILAKENFCLIRPLRYGRLYNFAVDELSTIWRTTDSYETKTSALISIVGILEFMDEAIYLDNASSILPLLLEGTNLQDDDSAKLASIKIIKTLIPKRAELIASHLDSVINRMIDRTRNTYFSPSDANAECRSAAIDVLLSLVNNIDKTELLKHKPKIILELDIALDDCSSVVRSRAQTCKLKWFGLSSA